MAAILFQPQCVNKLSPGVSPLRSLSGNKCHWSHLVTHYNVCQIYSCHSHPEGLLWPFHTWPEICLEFGRTSWYLHNGPLHNPLHHLTRFELTIPGEVCRFYWFHNIKGVCDLCLLILWLYNISGPFYYHGITLIPSWISNYIHHKVWDEITYPFPNFKCATIEVWECISNLIPHFTGHMIISPCWD